MSQNKSPQKTPQKTPQLLEVKNLLASTPEQSLKYGCEITYTLGKKKSQILQIADPQATRALVALMDMTAVMGGAASHWGGPAAFAELMSIVYGHAFDTAKSNNEEYYEKFHLVNDAGHCENGIYALKANYGYADLTVDSLKGFRSIKSPLTGHGEVHLFSQGVYLSNGPLGSSLPQAQGLAMADSLSGKNRTTVVTISDGACFEGEAKEALAAIPGLAKKKKMAPFVCIISDNNTKLSGRIDEQSFSMEETFLSLKNLGWKVLDLKDAHNLQEVMATYEEAIELAENNPLQPVAIHARTIKGYGVKKTEESASGGHGFPLKKPQELTEFLSEIYNGHEVPSEFTDWKDELIKQNEEEAAQLSPQTNTESSSNSKDSDGNPKEKVQVGVASALIRKRQEGLPIISITSDLPGSTGLAAFCKKFPEASFDVGIAESNMVSSAVGFSKAGYIPVVDTFAQFGVTKGALPFIMSSLSQGPMIAVFSHVGFQDAADGASHQALSYFSMMSAVPGVEVYNLSSSEEADRLMALAIDQFAEDRKNGKIPQTYVFFLGRENFHRRNLAEDYNYQLGKAQVVFDNVSKGSFSKNVTIAAAGALLSQAITASKELEKQNIGTIIINSSIINRPDTVTFSEALEKTNGQLVTVEDHQLTGGMGAMLCHSLLQEGVNLKVKSLGVKGSFGQSAYKADELYAKHGLDSMGITAAALSLN